MWLIYIFPFFFFILLFFLFISVFLKSWFIWPSRHNLWIYFWFLYSTCYSMYQQYCFYCCILFHSTEYIIFICLLTIIRHLCCVQFFFLDWFFYRIIVLQNFVVFCQTSTWINHRHTYLSSLLNLHPISISIPPL